MSFRSDLDALAARHDALAADVAAKTKELDNARQLLDDAKARLRLPVLPNIRVATPCPADWNQMTGDDRVRACATCNKSVYNLSGMTRDEAEALIVAKEGNLCVRYFQRNDGTILLEDCEVGVKQKRKRRIIAAGAAAMLAGGGLIGYKLTRKDAPERLPEPAYAIQGGLEMPDPPVTHSQQPIEEPVQMQGQVILDVHEIRGKVSIVKPTK